MRQAGSKPRGCDGDGLDDGQEADDAGEILVDQDEVLAAIGERLGAGDSPKDVVRMVSARFGLPRNEAYRLVMERP